MQLEPIPNHETLPDMPSATNTDHDGRYLRRDGGNVMLGDLDMNQFDIVSVSNINLFPSDATITSGDLLLTLDDVGNNFIFTGGIVASEDSIFQSSLSIIDSDSSNAVLIMDGTDELPGTFTYNSDDEELTFDKAFILQSSFTIDSALFTDAVITMDGTGNDPATLTYESDNALFILSKHLSMPGYTLTDNAQQDYTTTNRVHMTGLQGTGTGVSAGFELFTNDGDGTDDTQIVLWGEGLPADVSNSDFLQIQNGSSAFIKHGTAGTGTAKNLVLSADASDTQLVVGSDGDIDIANGLTVDTDTLVVDAVNHNVSIDGILSVGAANQILMPNPASNNVPSYSFIDAPTSGWSKRRTGGGLDRLWAIVSGAVICEYANTGVTIDGGDGYRWATGAVGGALGLSLIKDADWILAQKKVNDAEPQEFRIYNDATGNSEFTSLGFINTADTFTIQTEQVAAGVARDIAIIAPNVDIGTPGTTLKIESDADTYWVGEGTGLPYGSFWGNDIAFVSAGGTGTYFEIADGDITVGQTNLTTFQNNKELAVTKEGVYKVDWSMSVKGTGANKHIVGGIGVDVGGAGALVIQNDGRNHSVSTGNAEFALSGTAILDLSASSEVGLMATNETDGTNVTVEHVTMSIIQVGGT